MATVNLDTLRDIGLSEQGGVVVALKRSVQVVDLTAGDAISVAYGALTALDGAGLTAQSTLTGHTNLVLMDRNVRIIDTTKAEVDLDYRHFAENELQDLSNPPGGELVFQCEGGLQEKSTQVDAAGTSIILGYTYSSDAAEEPSAYKSKTTLQAGEVSVRIPTRLIRLVGTLATNDPDTVVNGILGFVNDDTWRSGLAREWMCTVARYTPWDREAAGERVWRFEFAFEYNSDGWDPKAVFVHEATGKVVNDWKTNAGYDGHASYAVVEFAGETDFEDYFAALGVAKTDDEF